MFFSLDTVSAFTSSWVLHKFLKATSEWMTPHLRHRISSLIFQKGLQSVYEINYQFCFFQICFSYSLLTKCEVKWTFTRKNFNYCVLRKIWSNMLPLDLLWKKTSNFDKSNSNIYIESNVTIQWHMCLSLTCSAVITEYLFLWLPRNFRISPVFV